MADEGFLAGLPVTTGGRDGLLVAVTERRTRAELDRYAQVLAKVIS